MGATASALFVGLGVVFAIGLLLFIAEILYVCRNRVWIHSPCPPFLSNNANNANNANNEQEEAIINNNCSSSSNAGSPLTRTRTHGDNDPRFLAKLFPLSTHDSFYNREGPSPLFTIKEDSCSFEGGQLLPLRNQWRYAYSIGLVSPKPQLQTPKKPPLLLQPPSPSPQPITAMDLCPAPPAVSGTSFSSSVSSASSSSAVSEWEQRRLSRWSSGDADISSDEGTSYGTPVSSPSQLRKCSPSPTPSVSSASATALSREASNVTALSREASNVTALSRDASNVTVTDEQVASLRSLGSGNSNTVQT
eukprot:TRINITY_DN1867_c0_g1_i1.p1 TRINITY_DN1867_c0_g1~~TRINITY_DN1867_c0_g1_i1.p1  ORF type:complete len:306 (+),score=-33.01 TRINITY_DN1867_c0_g1_i1:131-1048(+)